MALPFLVILGMDEEDESDPPLARQVGFSSPDGTAGSSGGTRDETLGGSVVPRWEPHSHAHRSNIRGERGLCQG